MTNDTDASRDGSMEICRWCKSAFQAERDRADAAKAEVRQMREALRAITIENRRGRICFRKGNGVPMQMDKRLEAIVSAALAEKAEPQAPCYTCGSVDACPCPVPARAALAGKEADAE